VSRRERKVVTVLFCDLVGFTSQAESMDPEDVEALLAPYHFRLRSELERHGGTVEKFIGDAVMALFGAPVAHEDDPERAVRAALAIRQFAVDEELELRIGITTGDALVRLDAQPGAGEGMASGDVVNTAARLQSAAPVNGILVDETTYRATRTAVDYENAEAVEAKGKTDPIAVWEAKTAHSRFGVDIAHEARAELVGRERELGVIRDAFERARHERTPQLLTLVGVPGIGKSRLVYELSRIADADPELVTWRQGRCLAYGDGVTLWALSEIVKAQAGIVEQDSPAEVEQKLRKAVADVLADTGDSNWVESQLRSLVGIAAESELGDDRRQAAFAAWRRFLEAMAEQRPLVVVFEDLHWADESLLDFVDELVDWVTDVPLLAVATARPELLGRRPGWGGGKLNATTLALPPLSEDQTALLIAQLLERSVLPAESQQALLERAGGNPLYAEQFAELFLERGSADELGLPETLQGIIAARLDGLADTEKDLLRDAAVIGKVFWASAVRNGSDASTTLHSLERKGFVRRQKRSSVEGETEFAFAHALVRDVAYGQIARADRAEKHRGVAEWIEGLGRPEDHAEMLAHHWQAAYELARAAGVEAPGLADRARVALREAGDRAAALNAYPTAEKYYAEALALWPDGDPERPDLLFRRARSLHLTGDDRRQAALEEARDALIAVGEAEPAAEAEAFLAHGAWYRGDRDTAQQHFSYAEALVVDGDASASKTRVLALSARFRMLKGDYEEAISVAQGALEIAEALELDELRAHALTTIGSAKFHLELSTGRPDLEQALEIALAADSPIAAVTLNNLGVVAIWEGEFPRAHEIYPEAIRIAERFGDRDSARFMRGNWIYGSYVVGRWDEALQAADDFILECASSPHYGEGLARDARAEMRVARGDFEGAKEDLAFILEHARRIQDPQRLLPALAHSAVLHLALGNESEARELAVEAVALARDHIHMAAAANHLIFVAGQFGLRDAYREIVEHAPEGPWKDLALAGASGDLQRAGDVYASFGSPSFEGLARLFGGEELIAAGRRAEGEAEIELALAFYRSVGATFYVERAERLLAEAQRASA
jgi:class 3 adenylate cyclase/tetratricopeptide (TPR) repeat protein